MSMMRFGDGTAIAQVSEVGGADIYHLLWYFTLLWTNNTCLLHLAAALSETYSTYHPYSAH